MPEASDSEGRQERALREAAEWLARQQVGRIDEAAFARWRDTDPAHALAFCRVLALWRAGIAAPPAMPPASGRRLRVPTPSRRDMLRAGGMAGVGALLAAGAFVAPAYAWTSASTGVGESRRVVLPDGSHAELNTDSRLSWRFSPEHRVLWLERGEICLSLHEGPAAMLRGGPSAITMSPGRFNMRLRPDAVELLVLDGRAEVAEGGGARAAVALRGARTMLVSRQETIARTATPDQVATTMAWRDHALLFQDVTLGSAVDDYNRYLLRKIVIVDPDLAATPIGGRFETDDPAAFLKAIAVGLGIHVTISDQAYFLTKGPSYKSNRTV